MSFDTESSFLKDEIIKKIEDAYKCKYVFESCIKDKSGHWANVPCAIFYSEKKHPVGSNYMAMFINSDGLHLSVADGITATEPFNGLLVDDKIIYSRYLHDFREYKGYHVDGGRDYFKYGGDNALKKLVKIKVVKDKLVLDLPKEL